MTDRELSTLGERLYSAILAARLSEPAMRDLAEAIEERCPWPHLSSRSKVSIFVVAAQLERIDVELVSRAETDVAAKEAAECAQPASSPPPQPPEAIKTFSVDDLPPSPDRLDSQALQDVLEEDDLETRKAAATESAEEPSP